MKKIDYKSFGEPPKEKQSVGRQLKTTIQDVFSNPKETFLPACRVELIENRQAVVEGCKGVLEYNENVVQLSCGKLIIRFVGTGLQIKNLTASTALVEGVISSMDYSC